MLRFAGGGSIRRGRHMCLGKTNCTTSLVFAPGQAAVATAAYNPYAAINRPCIRSQIRRNLSSIIFFRGPEMIGQRGTSKLNEHGKCLSLPFIIIRPSGLAGSRSRIHGYERLKQSRHFTGNVLFFFYGSVFSNLLFNSQIHCTGLTRIF